MPFVIIRRNIIKVIIPARAGIHACVVERSSGFADYDVDVGLFHDRCTVMDSRLRENDVTDPRK